MRIRVSIPEQFVTPDVVEPVLETVTRVNEHLIRSGQSPTSHELIKAGAIWRPESPGDEHFDHGGTIASRGWGDCDDWAPLHAATLRASGEDPGARAIVYPSGPSTFHASVLRSSGELDDPSVAAGMRPPNRVSGADGSPGMLVHVCDPHDGRIYTGQLMPAVGPLSMHCGLAWHVRGVTADGWGDRWEARVDVPIAGSPLVHVHSYYRRRGHHRRHRVHGSLPYAISCTCHGETPFQALNGAMCGAIVCADAAELSSSADRYKLLAVQAAMAGMTPGQVRDALIAKMTEDMQAASAASGRDPREHAAALLEDVASAGRLNGNIAIGDFFSDIAHAASGVVDAVQSVAKQVGPWVGDIVHGVQAAVSLIPGIGTAVSDVIAAAETAYDAAAAALSGNPLEAAIHAAYNFALASIPGASAIRIVLDPVVDALIQLTVDHEPVESAVLNSILDQVPDSPKFGNISPRSIAASIAHLIVSHIGVKKSTGAAPKPAPVRAAAPPAPARTPARVIPLHVAPHVAPAHPAAAAHVPLHIPSKAMPKLPGVAHASIHTALAAPLASRAPASTLPKPGSPGAPPGATHWTCKALPDQHGAPPQWQCRWV